MTPALRFVVAAALAAVAATTGTGCSPAGSSGNETPAAGTGGATATGGSSAGSASGGSGAGGSGSGGAVAGSPGSAGSGPGSGGAAGSSPGSGGDAMASGGSGGAGNTGGASGTGDAAAPGEAGPVSGTPGDRSPGCDNGKGLPEGEATIMAAGLARKYRVHLPKGFGQEKDRAWPLVLALHPNGGAGIGFFEDASRPVRTLLADKAILILPLARPLSGGWDWRGNLPSDLAYFEALLTLVKTEMCVDTKRIFSLGFSGGASFSGVLGCRRTDIRAIATAGAVSYFDTKDCVGNPAAWIAIGKGELEAGRTAFRDFWRNRATCQATSSAVEPSPCVAYAGCAADRPVQYCEHPAGHIWPPFASQAAVDFFLKF